MGLNYSPIFRH